MIDDRQNEPSHRITDKPPGDQQLTAIELAQVHSMREMVKQLVLARNSLIHGDIENYTACCTRATDIVDSIKREIDQLFHIYHAELLSES